MLRNWIEAQEINKSIVYSSSEEVLRMSEVWLKVCTEDDLVTGSGVCALLSHADKDVQIALFKINDTQVYALSNYDPLGEAQVLSRGIIGSIGDKLVVASPLYKQHFCLDSGLCLEDASVSVSTWPARIMAGEAQLRVN